MIYRPSPPLQDFIVRSILAGERTQLRIPMRPQPEHLQHHEWHGRVIHEDEHRMWCWKDQALENLIDFNHDRDILARQCPYGQPGDRLWVREGWGWIGEHRFEDHRSIYWRAERNDWADRNWRPAASMPQWASRITLELAHVRVQRLHDITETDALAEGVIKSDGVILDHYEKTGETKTGYSALGIGTFPTAVDGFRFLWNVANHKTHPFSENPFVWALSFRRLK